MEGKELGDLNMWSKLLSVEESSSRKYSYKIHSFSIIFECKVLT